MRARTVLATIAFAGTVLLGGAAQAIADDNDDMSNFGADFGSSSPAAPAVGQGTSDSDQDASGFDQDASGFGQGGSVFDQAVGR